MRYLILGGSGLLGSALATMLVDKNDVSFTYHKNELALEGASAYKIDLEKTGGIGELIEKIRPEIIINAASAPSVDWHDQEKEKAYSISAVATKIIAEKSKMMGARLVYISSAFVFPSSNRVFAEEDIPAPINFYGVCKLGGELAAKVNPKSLIIRTDQIYGWARKNQKKSFVERTLEKLAKGERVEVCKDWYNSPTYVKDLGVAIIKLIEKNRAGIYHLVGNSFLNRYEWAKKIAIEFGKNPSFVVPIDSQTLNLPAKRPNCQLSNQKIQKELGIKMKTVEEGLADMKSDQHE